MKVKNQPIEKAAGFVITGIEKKIIKYHLTNQGNVGTKLYSLFPSFINNTVKSEMKKINEDIDAEDTKNNILNTTINEINVKNE